MLEVVVPASEQFDPINNLFYYTKEQKLVLEHSLVSLAKWESKWHKPFLSRDKKTYEETVDYIRCMTLTQNVNPLVYNNIPQSVIEDVDRYIDEPMTAATFAKDTSPLSSEFVTAEIIYYWMTALNIPFKCQKWHLNRLLTLIRVCSIKSAPPKKMGRRETLSRNRTLNRTRRKRLGTKG